jgi:hypothetical protein
MGTSKRRTHDMKLATDCDLEIDVEVEGKLRSRSKIGESEFVGHWKPKEALM